MNFFEVTSNWEKFLKSEGIDHYYQAITKSKGGHWFFVRHEEAAINDYLNGKWGIVIPFTVDWENRFNVEHVNARINYTYGKKHFFNLSEELFKPNIMTDGKNTIGNRTMLKPSVGVTYNEHGNFADAELSFFV